MIGIGISLYIIAGIFVILSILDIIAGMVVSMEDDNPLIVIIISLIVTLICFGAAAGFFLLGDYIFSLVR